MNQYNNPPGEKARLSLTSFSDLQQFLAAFFEKMPGEAELDQIKMLQARPHSHPQARPNPRPQAHPHPRPDSHSKQTEIRTPIPRKQKTGEMLPPIE